MEHTALGAFWLSVAPLFARAGGRTKTVTMAYCVSLVQTVNGWRMEIECREGKGAIVLADARGRKQYSGSGILAEVFAEWSQEQVDAMYQSLIPRDYTPFQLAQFG